jgi:hypothetical protein
MAVSTPKKNFKDTHWQGQTIGTSTLQSLLKANAATWKKFLLGQIKKSDQGG